MEKKLKIILCEDNLSDAELVRYTLRKFKFDFELDHVTNRGDFEKYLSENSPDLILSDFNMGQFNGIDALNIAKSTFPLVPFIIVTGTLDEYTAVDTIKAGAWDYVIKENLLRLKPAIDNALKLKQERELKRGAENKLRESEEEYRTLYQNVPVGVFRLNKNGKLMAANSAFLDMFGFESEDMIRELSLSNFFVQENQFEKLEQLLRSTHLIKNFDSILELNDHSFDALLSIKACLQDGEVDYYDCIVQNITELKEIQNELKLAKEKAEESNKLKEIFLANLSHEIRTPLNAIFGFSDLIVDDDIELEQRLGYLKTIKTSSQQLFTVFNDIMDLSLIESGQILLDQDDFVLNEIMEEMLVQYRQKIQSKEKHSLSIDLTPGLKMEQSMIKQDSIRLRQVINNLLSNAVKFSHQGKIEFGYDYLPDKDVLQMFVKDTGVGIPREKRDVIFDSFRQVEETYTRTYGGTGLGLAIAKALVEKMGGDLWFESVVGKGSTFYFTIPYHSDSRSRKNEEIQSTEDTGISNKTILIVEDEEINYLYLEELLHELDLTVLHAINKDECFAILDNEKVDLILMDLRLPGMNGFDITRLIREMNSDVPIIAQTAYSTPQDKDKALKSGCDDFIAKPFTKKEMLGVIQKYL